MSAKTTPKLSAPDAVVVDSVAGLKALADPTRLRILLELTAGPRTVKEIAAAFGVAQTRLYYHVKILERSGIIRVANRRLVSGIEERTYEAVATNVTVSPDAIKTAVGAGVIGALVNVVRAELELALQAGGTAPIGETDHPVPILTLTRLALSEREVADVQERLVELIERYGEPSKAPPGKKAFHAFLATYQSPSELSGRPVRATPSRPKSRRTT